MLSLGKERFTVDDQEIARRLLHNFGIRIEREMSAYARRQLEIAASDSFSIMGTHARTGVPLRATIDVSQLRGAADATSEIKRSTY
jgi:hypothetical protein